MNSKELLESQKCLMTIFSEIFAISTSLSNTLKTAHAPKNSLFTLAFLYAINLLITRAENSDFFSIGGSKLKGYNLMISSFLYNFLITFRFKNV